MALDVVSVEDVVANAVAPLRVVSATEALTDQMARLTSQLNQLQGSSQAAAELVRGATSGEPVTASRVVDTVRSALPGGGLGGFGLSLGLSPLISAVARLFGGGGESEPPPLVRFELPEPVGISAGVSESVPGGAFAVDRAQGGLPRPVTVAPQITVQVQAMDSRSFLAHSNDIALAVRQAMLESSVLNDVVRET
jgi:hypothetical protein